MRPDPSGAEVLGYAQTREWEFLLLSELPGLDAVRMLAYRAPAQVIGWFVDALTRWHEAPMRPLPADVAPARELSELRLRCRQLGDVPELAEAASALHGRVVALAANPPHLVDPVATHGDFSLPNVMLQLDGRLSGYLDVGRAAMADRRADIAVAVWSLSRNLPEHRSDVDQACRALGVARSELAPWTELWELRVAVQVLEHRGCLLGTDAGRDRRSAPTTEEQGR